MEYLTRKKPCERERYSTKPHKGAPAELPLDRGLTFPAVDGFWRDV